MKDYLSALGFHGIPAVANQAPASTLRRPSGACSLLRRQCNRFLLLPAAWTLKDFGIIARQILQEKIQIGIFPILIS